MRTASEILRYFVSVRGVPVCLYLLIGLTIERLAHAAPIKNRLFNLKCTAIFQIFDFFGGAFVMAVVAVVVNYLPWRPMIVHAHPGVWGAIYFTLLVSLFGDFGMYWIHRFEHTNKWLWAIHQLHHSDEAMNITTTFRSHWMETLLTFFPALLPALFLPKPLTSIPLWYLLRCGNTFLAHLNVNAHFGWFNRIAQTPETHRIHHSRLPEHIDKNFSGMWTIWDILFRTYVHPTRGEFPPTGLISEQPPETVREAMLRPFKTWGALGRITTGL